MNDLNWLSPGAARYTGPVRRYLDFTLNHQLLNEATWRSFVWVFRSDSDDGDLGWRCEYWGKMMRGACLVYRSCGREDLYAVLRRTVEDLLDAQRTDGRISTYSREKQLSGWDLWGRKYVLTGMLHFYDICREEPLRARILAAMCRHADAIVAEVGEGKRDITATSDHWGGVNSCSILEPMVALYRRTGNEAYLGFASYIVGTGGCRDGNLIRLALEDRLKPYEYPEIKAYETMSFFEGVLAYYEVTGKKEYLEAALNFTEAVAATDITVIGCAGCRHELFDHSTRMQTRYTDGLMQETCVTVTWMRLMARLHLLTGRRVYMDRLETAAWNALYGSVNENGLKQYSFEEKVQVEPLPFDSYSPLLDNARGRGIGGFKRFAFGGYYGCCACIASAGIGLHPLTAVLRGADGPEINEFLPGTAEVLTPSDRTVTLKTDTSYPADGDWTMAVHLDTPERMTFRIRMPEGISDAQWYLNGRPVTPEEREGYLCWDRLWSDGDELRLRGTVSLTVLHQDGKTAFRYGPLVLARDSAKEADPSDLQAPVALLWQDGRPVVIPEAPDPSCGELVRLRLRQADGGTLLLTDYASCGKNWLLPRNKMTVWQTIE